MVYLIIVSSFILILLILFFIWYQITIKVLSNKINEIKNQEDVLINLLKQMHENLANLYNKKLFKNNEKYQELKKLVIKINTETNLYVAALSNLNELMLEEIKERPEITSNNIYLNLSEAIMQLDIKIQVEKEIYNKLVLEYNELITYKFNKIINKFRKSEVKKLFKYNKFDLPINKQYL